MKKYTLTRMAEKDIREIWKYTVENWGESQAFDYLNGLEMRLEELSEAPDTLGITRPDIKPNYMSCLYKSHIVFFIKRTNSIEVIRVLHQSMDIPRRMM